MMIWGLKTCNIRYNVDYQMFNPQQTCNKAATTPQHFVRREPPGGG
jgi:hypothetical protein